MRDKLKTTIHLPLPICLGSSMHLSHSMRDRCLMLRVLQAPVEQPAFATFRIPRIILNLAVSFSVKVHVTSRHELYVHLAFVDDFLLRNRVRSQNQSDEEKARKGVRKTHIEITVQRRVDLIDHCAKDWLSCVDALLLEFFPELEPEWLKQSHELNLQIMPERSSRVTSVAGTQLRSTD